MPLGAIVKAGAKSLAKNQAKKIATDKLMGRGGKKVVLVKKQHQIW